MVEHQSRPLGCPVNPKAHPRLRTYIPARRRGPWSGSRGWSTSCDGGWVRGATGGQPKHLLTALDPSALGLGRQGLLADPNQPRPAHHHSCPSSHRRQQRRSATATDGRFDSPLARDVEVDVLPSLVLHGCDGGWSACTKFTRVGSWGKKKRDVDQQHQQTKNARTASGAWVEAGVPELVAPSKRPNPNPAFPPRSIWPHAIRSTATAGGVDGSVGGQGKKGDAVRGARTDPVWPRPSILALDPSRSLLGYMRPYMYTPTATSRLCGLPLQYHPTDK